MSSFICIVVYHYVMLCRGDCVDWVMVVCQSYGPLCWFICIYLFIYCCMFICLFVIYSCMFYLFACSSLMECVLVDYFNVCICLHTCKHTHTCTYICIHTYTNIHACTCAHMHIYTYIHTYIHTHIHTRIYSYFLLFISFCVCWYSLFIVVFV